MLNVRFRFRPVSPPFVMGEFVIITWCSRSYEAHERHHCKVLLLSFILLFLTRRTSARIFKSTYLMDQLRTKNLKNYILSRGTQTSIVHIWEKNKQFCFLFLTLLLIPSKGIIKRVSVFTFLHVFILMLFLFLSLFLYC